MNLKTLAVALAEQIFFHGVENLIPSERWKQLRWLDHHMDDIQGYWGGAVWDRAVHSLSTEERVLLSDISAGDALSPVGTGAWGEFEEDLTAHLADLIEGFRSSISDGMADE